jgi:hypothetical protein
VLEKLDIHILLFTIHKNQPKWIEHLNVRSGTIKLLEENMRKMLQDIG